jgi:hypothetical protein
MNTALAIIRYDFNARNSLIVEKMVAKGNRIRKGQFFKLDNIGNNRFLEI